MTEPNAETPTPPSEGEGTPTVAELAQRVDQQDSKLDRVLELLGGGGRDAPTEATPEPEPVDVGAEVRREMERLHAKEEARAKREAEDDAKLTDKIKQVTEKAPREFKRATERMGWVGPNDR